MTEYDLVQLYQKWLELDRELKLLKQEVGLIKQTLEPKKQWVPQWEEDLYEDYTK
jgi:hypothetical protein